MNSRIQLDRSQNKYTNYRGIKNSINSGKNYWNTRETGYSMSIECLLIYYPG
jgi:hypothetical protein